MVKIIFWSLCAVAVIAMTVYYVTRLKRWRTFVYGALTGFVSLILLNIFGNGLGITMPLNIFNVSGSIILGVPFVICMVILNFL